MRFLSSTLIASMLLNGLAVPASSRAADESSQVCNTVGFTAEVPEDRAEEKCNITDQKQACVDARKAVAKWSEDYKKIAKEACEKHQKALGEISQLSQKSSFDEVKSKANAGIADIDTLLAANEKILSEMPKITQANINALKQFSQASTATPVYKTRMNEVGNGFTQAYQKRERFKSDIVKSSDNSGISGAKANSSKAHLEALGQSQLFIRSLIMDKEKNEAAKQKLTEARDNAGKNAKNTNTAESGKKDESGFNPMSLLPLAAPLAGLLMQKKQQQSGVTDPAAQPTNPYPTAPEKLGGTSLDPKSSNQASGAKFENSKTPSTEMNMPAETYAGSSNGILEPFEGDITNKNGESKSNPLSGAGAYSANAGGFSSDSSGASATPGKSDRKPASATQTAPEEGLINSSGGGGGGYSASSSTETSAEADGGMKDVLHDMESTLEEGPTGLFAEGDQQASADGVAAENSESLFPRVRACHVRNLKKGFVLNGLGEKLPESESH